MLFNDAPWHRLKSGEGAEVDEVGSWIFELDSKRVIIQRGDTDLREVCQFALVKIAGVFDNVKLGGIVSGTPSLQVAFGRRWKV